MKPKLVPVALLFFSALIFLAACNSNQKPDFIETDGSLKHMEVLSDYHFFVNGEKGLSPVNGVFAYHTVNSMFADYLHKEQFIYLPAGAVMNYDSQQVLQLPVGACIINSLYYYVNERDSNGTKQYVETQLLLHSKGGWEAKTYEWDEKGADAQLTIVGDVKSLAWKDVNGIDRKVDYVIANKNQCKGCHWYKEHISPIGIKAGNLNTMGTDGKNQLNAWATAGTLKGYNREAPAFVNWRDTSAPQFARVKSYLDINCAHCHNANGPAYVSGLHLNRENDNMETYGVFKSPPSAGRGSCNLKYDIVPGSPGESIIICRMAATELGVKMPQMGRTVTDNEGVTLVANWITDLKKQQAQQGN
ncbi:MAG: hypothetical protein U0T75_08840 [Chitinophagales bacterium]